MHFPDYHIHTTLCKHAEGEMEEYVEHALRIGLEEMGFSDHMPLMPEPQFCMDYSDLPGYLERVRDLRERYRGRIDIRLGCEMDMVAGREDEIRGIIERSGFDYVIGSIHYLDGWPFDQEQYRDVFEKNDLGAIYDLFFETVIRAARTGLYDVTGHIDNIKRMGYRLSGDMTPYYERTAAALREMDLAFEVNTSGFDTAAEEQYPSLEFLRVLNRHGVPVTLGSDSHRPGQVGRYFGRAYRVLREAGYDRVAYFRNRERIMIPLSEISGETAG
jgi:histidinol-phosphatase (PHP family)